MSTQLHHNHRGKGGFSLVELLIVTLVFGIIITGALGFMTAQNRAFNRGSDRLEVLQNLRYAFQALDMDLQTLGSNVPAGQPPLVLADDDVIAFSADYASNVENDFSAVYIDVDAPDGTVQVPTSSISLPNSSFTWPDTTYGVAGGGNSPAELIIYYFEPDGTTSRSDDYVLMRQFNDASPEVLSRNILKQGSTPFFRYFQRRVYEGAAASLDSISGSDLPLFHYIKIHGSADDTASSAQADSIRAVRVTFRATNGQTGADERFADISRVIDLPNAGVDISESCGDEPLLGSDLDLQLVALGGETRVRIRWPQATDEATGEKDVVRYVLYRRELPASGGWGDPFLSIPSGSNSYQYDDSSVESGKTYQYVHTAQDCTPAMSGFSAVQQISLP